MAQTGIQGPCRITVRTGLCERFAHFRLIKGGTPASTSMVPSFFGTRDRFRGRQSFHRPGSGDGSGMLHLLSTLFLFLLQLYVNNEICKSICHNKAVIHEGVCISLYSQKLWLFHITYRCESWTIKKAECRRTDASGGESWDSWACGLENKLWMDGSASGRTLTKLGVYQEAGQRERGERLGQRGRRSETKQGASKSQALLPIKLNLVVRESRGRLEGWELGARLRAGGERCRKGARGRAGCGRSHRKG